MPMRDSCGYAGMGRVIGGIHGMRQQYQQYRQDASDHTVWVPGASQAYASAQPAGAPLSNAAKPGYKLTIFRGNDKIGEVSLDSFGKNTVYFGRAEVNDIVIDVDIVSGNHGVLRFERGTWVMYDLNSSNGTRVNGEKRSMTSLAPGDILTIGLMNDPSDCVILMYGYDHMHWYSAKVPYGAPFSIGRHPGNNLVLPSPTVSGNHARILFDAVGQVFIQDLDSYNGTYVMGRLIRGVQHIVPGDIISIALTPMVYTGNALIYCSDARGVDVFAWDLVQIRKNRKQQRVTTDHVSLHIGRGEFVAIVGGSGSGKSTLLNELNGSDPAVQGSVFVDGIDLYPNYNYLKKAIGYVPQQDIVYDNLTLMDMLKYAAELRMPPDFTAEERERRALEVIDLLELGNEKDNLIGRMSGGQKKRASIAVELLADPRLLFLDEPTSGLDPGIERDLMHKLANMAEEGRTIVLVTHTTLNLNLCSKVVFLGAGGKLCFAGPPAEALSFFGVEDFVPIYDIIAQDPDGWARRFAQQNTDVGEPVVPSGDQITPGKNPSFGRQLSTLSRRYTRLILNDKQRLLLLLLQAPALAALISLVAGSGCFTICEDTKSCLFALSCAAFWVGILNSIQEVCKERAILQREYAGGMKLSSYLLSKVLVLGVLCIVQSALLTGVFCAISGLPAADPLLFNTGFELLVTVTLLTLSAMCMGLWVSALFSNPDRAIAMAPILIMPQVLFSGLIFELEGAAKTISAFVNCRWAMEAFGTTADVNDLPLTIYGEEVTIPEGTQHIDSAEIDVPDTTTTYMGTEIDVPGERRTIEDFDVTVPETTKTIDGDMYTHEPDDAYLHILPHLMFDWGILLVFCVVCTTLSGITLRRSLRR